MPKKTLNTELKDKLSIENFSSMTTTEQNEFIKQAFDDFKVCLLGPNYVSCK